MEAEAAFVRLSRTSIASDEVHGASVGERLVYAVGDVHGCLDLLRDLVEGILEDILETGPAAGPMIIFLGDYIDRGPQSAEVLDYLILLKGNPAVEVRTLRGNHEQVLLSFLDQAETGQDWMSFGGGATLSAYGVKPPHPRAGSEGWTKVAETLSRKIPAAHLEFLRATERLICVGDFAFAHAGVLPDRALDEQTAEDVMWIRGRFTQADRPYEKVVVHGHTETDDVVVTPWRIGIDTAAYASGVMSALRLYRNSLSVLQARPEGGAAPV